MFIAKVVENLFYFNDLNGMVNLGYYKRVLRTEFCSLSLNKTVKATNLYMITFEFLCIKSVFDADSEKRTQKMFEGLLA